MNLYSLIEALTRCGAGGCNVNFPLRVVLPGGTSVPEHFHVTEIGRVHKEFIDCGGTSRQRLSCVLQVWVADDTEHRLTGGKLLRIIRLAEPALQTFDMPVEIEYESNGTISLFSLESAEVSEGALVLGAGSRRTTCLAPDKCGVTKPRPAADGCSTGGCCGR